MITILVEFKFAKKNVDEAKLLLKELADESSKEEGCIFYSALQDSSNKSKFILYEVFKDSESQEFHKTTPHYKHLLNERLRPLIKERCVRFLS